MSSSPIRTSRHQTSTISIFAILIALLGTPALAQQKKEYRVLRDLLPHPHKQSIAAAGDFNADGYDDFVVGERYNDPGTQSRSGRITVFSGRDLSILLRHPGSAGWDLGTAVAGAGDVDGDGYDDVLAAAAGGDGNRGVVWLFFGPNGTPAEVGRGSSWMPRVGDPGYGVSVAGLGDRDGDGHSEFVVGVNDGNGSTKTGLAVVYDGRTRTVRRTLSGGSDFGYSVAGAGDVDGDGKPDLVVAEPSYERQGKIIGVSHVFCGPELQTLHRFHGGENPPCVAGAGDVDGDGFDDVVASGTSSTAVFSVQLQSNVFTRRGSQFVSGAGDVNGDGLADVVAGATWFGQIYAGRTGAVLHDVGGTYRFSGAGDLNGDGFGDFLSTGLNHVKVFLGGPGPRPLHRIDGLQYGGQLGSSVAGVGDVDGDDHDDFLIGASNIDAAYLHSGRTGQRLGTMSGPSGSGFGASVAGTGDVDGDGVPDLIIGAPNDGGRGSATVISGVSSGAAALATLFKLHGSASGDQFGSAVCGAGDVDGDGFDDVAVGARYEDAANPARQDAGSARIFSGRTRAELLTVFGEAAHDELGTSVRSAGDLDTDRRPDLIVGAPRDDTSAADAGAALIYSTGTRQVIRILYGTAQNQQFGRVVDGGADVDADGHADLIVGSSAAPSSPGKVEVFSGANWSRIYDVTSPHGWLGWAARFAGDVNGDGYDDFVTGSFRPVTGTVARVHSGFDGGVLIDEFKGDSYSFGYAVAAAGDADGDGFADVLIASPHAKPNGLDDAGRVYVQGFDFGRSDLLRPGRARVHGKGCRASGSRQPRIGSARPPALGEPFELSLWGALTGGGSAALLLAGVRTEVPFLDCTVLTTPDNLLPAPVSATGRSTHAFTIPKLASLLGATAAFQWVVSAPAAPRAVPLAFSPGLEGTIGR